MGEANPS